MTEDSKRLRLPAFFPDGTYGVVRCVDGEDLRRVQVPGVVMNTYHLLTKPGVKTIRALGGLHQMAGWDRPILTDSGGFQVFSLIRENPKYGEIRAHEIIFRPERGQEKLILSPEKCIGSQMAFGSNIQMCLDFCTHPSESAETQQKSVDVTIEWGARCREAFDALVREKKLEGPDTPKLFAIIQGGEDEGLRRRCAEGLRAIGFDGYGFGGWPLDASGALMTDILRLTADLMPEETPKYAMGLGRPEGIAACFQMGYTLFDCVIPTREARHGRLYTWREDPRQAEIDETGQFYRFHYALDDRHMADRRPVDAHCDCPLCQTYSRGYLRHLFKLGDGLGLRLATLHNLRFYTRLMQELEARGRG